MYSNIIKVKTQRSEQNNHNLEPQHSAQNSLEQLQSLDLSGVKLVAWAMGWRAEQLSGPMNWIDMRKI